MNKRFFIAEVTIAVALIALTLLLLNPVGSWMPDMATELLILGVLVIFAVFANFVWRESARDERELLHRLIAGRVAFLVGAAGLVVGVIAQALRGTVDPWLVGSLVVMVLAKISGLIYSQLKH